MDEAPRIPSLRVEYIKERGSPTQAYQFMKMFDEIPTVLIYRLARIGEIPTVPIYHLLSHGMWHHVVCYMVT